MTFRRCCRRISDWVSRDTLDFMSNSFGEESSRRISFTWLLSVEVDRICSWTVCSNNGKVKVWLIKPQRITRMKVSRIKWFGSMCTQFTKRCWSRRDEMCLEKKWRMVINGIGRFSSNIYEEKDVYLSPVSSQAEDQDCSLSHDFSAHSLEERWSWTTLKVTQEMVISMNKEAVLCSKKEKWWNLCKVKSNVTITAHGSRAVLFLSCEVSNSHGFTSSSCKRRSLVSRRRTGSTRVGA